MALKAIYITLVASCSFASVSLVHARRKYTEAFLHSDQPGKCPTVRGQHGWRECVRVDGCAYVPRQSVRMLAHLRKFIGVCLEEEQLIAEVAPNMKTFTVDPLVDAMRFVAKDGSRWLPLEQLPLVSTVPDHERKRTLYRSAVRLSESIGLIRKKKRTREEEQPLSSAKRPRRETWPWSWFWGWFRPWSWKEAGGEELCRPASVWPRVAKRVSRVLQSCRRSYWQRVQDMGGVRKVATDYRFVSLHPSEFLQVEYGCWRNILSKSLRMPVQFEYLASSDLGNYPRTDVFNLNQTQGLLEWQPPHWAKSDKYGEPYDVGHLVAANHFDSDAELIEATNFMTNVVPQFADLNRYAWLVTEMITECAREGDGNENVFVIGGCVWPENPKPIEVIGKMEKVGYQILIPDFCWKIIATPRRGHVAFWIPNTSKAKISKSKKLGKNGVQLALQGIEKFVVSVADLEKKLASRQTVQTFSMSDEEKMYRPTATEMSTKGWSIDCRMD